MYKYKVALSVVQWFSVESCYQVCVRALRQLLLENFYSSALTERERTFRLSVANSEDNRIATHRSVRHNPL